MFYSGQCRMKKMANNCKCAKSILMFYSTEVRMALVLMFSELLLLFTCLPQQFEITLSFL